MLKKLKFNDHNHHFDYKNDIDHIIKIYAERGYDITYSDAVHAWEKFSETMCAGWMSLGEDDEVFHDTFYYFEEVE